MCDNGKGHNHAFFAYDCYDLCIVKKNPNAILNNAGEFELEQQSLMFHEQQ